MKLNAELQLWTKSCFLFYISLMSSYISSGRAKTFLIIEERALILCHSDVEEIKKTTHRLILMHHVSQRNLFCLNDGLILLIRQPLLIVFLLFQISPHHINYKEGRWSYYANSQTNLCYFLISNTKFAFYRTIIDTTWF